MTHQEFYLAVKKMRKLQLEYKPGFSSVLTMFALRKSEKKVDKEISELDKNINVLP